MRPAHKSISAGVWKFESRLVSYFEAALSEHPNLVLRPLPFRRSPSDSQLLFIPKKGERYFFMSTKLYVGNLAFQTTSQDLQELFGTRRNGSVCQCCRRPLWLLEGGFAFVEMSSEEEATSAIAQFNGKEIGGRFLKVNEAKPQRKSRRHTWWWTPAY